VLLFTNSNLKQNTVNEKMIRYILLSTLLLFMTPSPVVLKKISIVWNERLNSYGLVKGEADNYISVAEYKNEVNETGLVGRQCRKIMTV